MNNKIARESVNHQRRIIFIQFPFEFPSGGVAVTYQHASILSDNGFSSIVALPWAPKIDFYNSSAKVLIHNGRIDFNPGDIFVIPEGEGFLEYINVLRNAPVRKVMFCQNHYFLPFSDNPCVDFFSEFGVDSLIVSSQTIKNFIEDVYRVRDIQVIPLSIDKTKFSFSRKKRQIAYMPRKLPLESKLIKASFQRLFPEFLNIPWVPIDGISTAQAATIMSESEVFLSLSHRESFGLPPLEAMSCKCIVVGFYGDGGREYMTTQNGFWSDDGNWRGVVDNLGMVFKRLTMSSNSFQETFEAMSRTVDSYSIDSTKKALLGFWDKELRKPYPVEHFKKHY